jgi:hypothetical protein
MTISSSVLLQLINVSRKVVEKIKTHILCWVTFFFRKSCRLWDNIETCGVARMAADNMAHVRCMLGKWGYTHESTHPCTHPHPHTRARTQKNVGLILVAFPRQQWLRERASMLLYTYIASFVITSTCFGHSCDQLQDEVQREYNQYTSDYTKMREKPFLGCYQLQPANSLL